MPGCSSPEKPNHLRPQKLYLSREVRKAALHLGSGRGTVVWRATLDHVRDDHVFLRVDVHFTQHGVEELSRPAYKGKPESVLLGTRPLSHQENSCRRVATIDNQVGPAFTQLAAPAVEARELLAELTVGFRSEDLFVPCQVSQFSLTVSAALCT